MVQVKRQDRRKVYEYLLLEGVIVIKKDMALPLHAETGVKNLEVWMLLRSLRDKKLVDLVFSWQYYYYYLKAEGVKYVRDKLGIVEDVIPATFKKADKKFEDDAPETRQRGGKGGRSFGRGNRGAPRRNEETEQPAQ
ncbi:unnamed protein product (macronuclear) [Paramecium tetraurelia]|uniref:Plectin/eS10 N-terminal domain-containing protein n=3 Tax=Paramecium TaxID=5884 RepID=A0C9U6_PARTE|nr:uncharacterized protein GSPATT00006870001 [Paramecium tetraurelia]CAD8058751.1 unnamed protein product [Paramecium sonneborni]CAD8060704.1 unnamed protein product [Paramecium sonneborni]CAD8143993.1 unnamed protein product [Paramecium octaurelia]CAK67563.1 unnamed protein product [Paramecium tetraurelia]|eukprot:XP_001434960.1 hypothetical protein (macronuclear) [Paramecium tetraurelia strain d4-2]